MIRAIARGGSVSAAAEQLGVSQSALSHRIREAERRLGLALFFRENRRLVLTSAGKRVMQAAEVALGEVERAELEIEKLARGVRHVVRLGLANDTPVHWLPRLYQSLLQREPEIDLEVVADTAVDPAGGLEDNLFDLTLIAGPVAAPGLDRRPLRNDQMVAVVAGDHPLARAPILTSRQFADVVYITRHTLPERGREYELFFRRHDMLPARVIQAGTLGAVLELVAAGVGVTILPRWAVASHRRGSGLVDRPLGPDPIAIEWSLLMREKELSDSAVSRVANLLEGVVRE